MQRLASIPMCLFLTAGLLVSGCTSQYGAQKTKVNYYPQCYQPVNQLRQDENSTGKSTAAGAVGGALSDVGINDDFMKQLGEKLKPGSSALFVLVDSEITDKVLAELRAQDRG